MRLQSWRMIKVDFRCAQVCRLQTISELGWWVPNAGSDLAKTPERQNLGSWSLMC